MQHFSWG